MTIALSQTKYKNRTQFCSATLDVGRHYGFTYLPHMLKEGQKHTLQATAITTLSPYEDALRGPATAFAERHSYTRQAHRLGYDIHTLKVGSGKNADKQTCISFHIAGTRRAIAEATLISLATTALREAGIKNTEVHINALGNHESNQRYNKELTNFLKKNLPHTQTILDEIHEHPRRVLARLIQSCAPCVENAPSPMEFLNDDARDHLKKLLEYLESTGIAYTLDPTVMGSSDVWEFTLFDIREAGVKSDPNLCVPPRILAVGGRYSPFMRKAYKQAVDSTTVMLAIDGNVEVSKKDVEAPLPQTPFFFGHVSEVAKKVALNVLGTLREADIAVRHAVTRDTLTQQLTHHATHGTEKQIPEYMIIIGHKEALEGTAIVRNEKTRVQKEVPLKELASYLKRLGK
jgi:histidyl-tRNA synthetase